MGPEERSLAPGTLKTHTRAAGTGSHSRAETSGRERALQRFVLKTQEARAAGVWVSAPLNAPFQAAALPTSSFIPRSPETHPEWTRRGGEGSERPWGSSVWEGASELEGRPQGGPRARAEGASVPESPRNQERGLNRAFRSFHEPRRRELASATEPLPAALPQGEVRTPHL